MLIAFFWVLVDFLLGLIALPLVLIDCLCVWIEFGVFDCFSFGFDSFSCWY